MDIIISVIGIILGIAIVAIFAYRGYPGILLAPLGALIIAVLGGSSVSNYITNYGTGFANLAQSLLFTHFGALIFSECMKQSGGAASIAYWLADRIGTKHVMLVCILASSVLTAGGMSLGAYYCVYPIGLILCAKANCSRKCLAAAVMCGPWNFGIISPLMPSVHNGLFTSFTGLDGATAGLVPGLAGGLVMLVFCVVFLEGLTHKWQREGKGFEAWDMIESEEKQNKENLPPWWRALLPLILVLVLYNIVKLPVVHSLILGCVAICVLEYKSIGPKWFRVWADGASAIIIPVMSTAAMGAIGEVLKYTPAFNALMNAMISSSINPYIMIFVCVNLVGFCLATCSGCLSTVLTALMPLFDHYGGLGYDVGNMARIAAIASAGLSAGPQSGGICGALAVYKTNHKDAYFPIFMTCGFAAVVGGIVAVIFAMLGFN